MSRAPQPSEVPLDANGEITGESQTQTDWEIELVIASRFRFPQNHPEHIRIRGIDFWCNRNGALRDGFPPGTEAEEKAWNDLVAECRRMAQ